VEHEGLMPNSRRDDFVDNKDKGFFYNAVERKIGLPISKEIRLRSRQKSEAKLKAPTVDEKKEPVSLPALPSTQAKKVAQPKDSEIPANTNELASNSKILEDILRTCGNCPTLAKILERNSHSLK
jgi:hypothetical protein